MQDPSRSRSRSFSRAVGAALAVAVAACQTPRPKAPAAPGADFLHGYVGQQRILRFQGDRERVVSRKKDKPQLPGVCDAAVQVRSAVRDKGSPRLVLDTLGIASSEKTRPRCKPLPVTVTLSLTGFEADAPEPIVARLDQLLPTPEGYLGALGVRFDLAPGSEPAVAASSPTTTGSSDEERRLERRVTAWPRKLLWVDPVYHDSRRALRHEGEVDFEVVVGADGRLYRPQIKGGLDKAHVAAIQGALALWRFEPARAGKDPLAARQSYRLVFRIY